VPTFGAPEMIKFNEKARLDHNLSRVQLGAALVLPYFTFDTTGREAEEVQMFVTASDFPIATKAALQYYNEKDLAFDQIYFLGDSLGQKVGGFSPGNRTQRNRPHYIELVAALAAFDFFEHAGAQPPGEPLFFMAARDGETIDWTALPTSRNGEQVHRRQQELKLNLAAMTAFVYAFNTHGAEVLRQEHGAVLESWYRHHFKFRPRDPADADKDPRTHRDVLDGVGRFGHQFIRWLCDLDDETERVRLIDRRKLVMENGAEVELYAPEQNQASIGSFLKDGSGNSKFHDFKNELDRLRIEEAGMRAPDRYVSLFHRAAVQFARAGFRIN
jgi:hypothetical protein